ncbi:beta-glucosidase [Alsobacter soli]|uniref:beta-glucosidase n=1 Tax=Alsobacter soli TaxID=2109933 RepID=A0A2T1HRI6_9HYPH|nr:glycoside hydrolase family 3 N-terminal domain-containing protein [Alsobacter soli]PSC04119.1 beta-glucosidase [Alsobacter soli]
MPGNVEEDRIERLLAAMTLAEKVGQLTMTAAPGATTGPAPRDDLAAAIRRGAVGSVLNAIGRPAMEGFQRVALEETRLGIPLLFGLDVVHGYRTVTPIPLGEAAAFDPGLWRETARLAAAEASRDGVALTFAPMLDVCRDPRWGRIAEGPGEDPWLASLFARAKVAGFQGPGSWLASDGAIAATAKHLGAYGAVTAGRDYASVDVSERLLQEVYVPPFKAAVEAGVAAIMPAFVDLGGVPMTANQRILRDLVRGDWGFGGVIVSDYGAIAELMKHGVAADIAEAAALALRATVDIDMMGGAYEAGLPAALERGLVTQAQVDEAVRRVLRLKEKLGLFEDPFRRAAGPDVAPERARSLARSAATRSIVLLKNENALPLAPEGGPVAIIAAPPLGEPMLGPWSAIGEAGGRPGLPEALQAALPARAVHDVPAEALVDDAALARALKDASHVILFAGETEDMSGEAASRAEPVLPPGQERLVRRVLALGPPVILALASGRPLVATDAIAGARAVIATWFLGSEAAPAIADVLAGRAEPAGRLPVSWPACVGQIPIFYGQRPSGRPFRAGDHYTSQYLDAPLEPLFPFGHGLSYARFAIEAAAAERRPGADPFAIQVTAKLRHAGGPRGEATLFLFVRATVAAVARPVLELRGVRKAALDPGGSATLTFTLSADDFAYLDADLATRRTPEAIEIFVGFSADRTQLQAVAIRPGEGPAPTQT